MKKLTILAVLSIITILPSLGWGQKGHDVAAYIAEQNLSPKAKKEITKLLDGHSLVYYSNWMDNASHSDEYRYTSTWHYRNVDEGLTPETAPLNKKGDVVVAVEDLLEKLENRKANNMSKEEEKVAVMMLIHLVGDLHCPMHASRYSDMGGNRHSVYFFGRKTNLHKVWDTELIGAAHKWSYTEWATQLDIHPKAVNEEVAKGTPMEWFHDSYNAAVAVYEATPVDYKISYDYVADMSPLAEDMLWRAGIRLARVLNELYS